MIQPSLEIIKQSSEYKAAVALAGIHNAMSFKPEYFAKGICLQHQTLQQSIMRSFVATIRQMASDNYGYDDRNRSKHEAAKKMVESGILDEIYFPFI